VSSYRSRLASCDWLTGTEYARCNATATFDGHFQFSLRYNGRSRCIDLAEGFPSPSTRSRLARGCDKYTHLPTATSIRLLDIAPAPSDSSSIVCSLRIVDLDGEPGFDALSYTWSSPITVHVKTDKVAPDTPEEEDTSDGDGDDPTRPPTAVDYETLRYPYRWSRLEYGRPRVIGFHQVRQPGSPHHEHST
jgi:hypothetical protein